MRHDLLAASALLAFTTTLTAQTVGDTAELPEMVVTTTRSEQSTQTIPATVTIIDGEDLRAGGYLTVAEALASQPGVIVRSSSGTPATSEISMRGFGENSHGRVLILLDGVRLNRPDLATINWMQFPIANVERIEISRGGASALYGDQAVAGVIQVFSRKPGPGEQRGELAFSGGSFDTFALRAGTTGAQGGWTYSINADGYTTDGYRDNSGTDSYGLSLSLGHPVGERSDLSLAFNWQEVDYELPGYLTLAQMEADPRQSTNPDDSAEDSYLNGTFKLTTRYSDAVSSTIGLALGRKDVRSDIPTWSSFSDVTLDSIALTPHVSITGELWGREHTLLLGLDGYFDGLDQDRFGDASHGMSTGGASVDKTSVGLYLRDEATVAENYLLAVGGRVEWATIDAKAWSDGATTIDDSVDHSASAVDLALTRTIGESSKLYARAATLYRYPFVDEQVSFYGWGDAIYTDIDPETGVSGELGTHIGLASGWASAALFVLQMQDEISYNGVTFRNENLDDTLRYGAELAGSWVIGFLVLGADYSYTVAEFNAGPNDGKDVPLVPNHKGSVSADVSPFACVSATMTATYVGESYLGGDYGNLGPKLADYTVVDLFLKYRPADVARMELYAGVQNLFDEQYASIGYKGFDADGYYPSAGVSYQAGMRYTF